MEEQSAAHRTVETNMMLMRRSSVTRDGKVAAGRDH
jgi:hypothetical protein